jgi:hypothetical protein
VDTISEILKNSDKADAVEWMANRLPDSNRMIIICGKHNKANGGLDWEMKQFGFEYQYEIVSFLRDVVVKDFEEGALEEE